MFLRLGSQLLPAWLFLVAICPAAATVRLHVSPSGDDAHPGTPVAPLQTPAGALRRLRAEHLAGRERVEVVFGPGTYHMEEPLIFEPGDSGTARRPVLFRSAGQPGDGPAIFSGAVLLYPEWEPLSNGIWQARAPVDLVSDQLFLGGRRQTLARYPNYDPARRILGGFSADATSKDRASRWQDPSTGFLHVMHRHMWGDSHFRILGRAADGTLQLEGGWQNNRAEEGIHPEHRFVENLFEELDGPGEWFLNTRTAMLYLQPATTNGLFRTPVELARLRHLVEFRGTAAAPVRHIRLEGLGFTHTLRSFMENREPLLRSDWTCYRGGAAVLTGTEDCALTGCTFDQVGGNGIFVDGYNRRVLIRGCEITDAGANSIALVGRTNTVRSPLFNYHQTLPAEGLDLQPGPLAPDYPADCRVEDCLLTRNGRFEKQTAGVHIAMAARITVRHCSIYDCPRAGLNIGDGCWGGHLIEFCDIFETVKETGDHGSFNSWGRDRYWVPSIAEVNRRVAARPGLPFLDATEPVRIRNNRWRCDHGWDIDLDDGSTRYEIENNLCLNGGLKLREGYRRRVENNIIVNNSFHPHVWFKDSDDIFRRNIVMAGYYPIGMPARWGREVDLNLLPTEAALDQARQLGLDAHSVAAAPMFRDPTRGDYRVRRDSPALKLGFRNFPMDKFGVESPRLRARARQPVFPIPVTSPEPAPHPETSAPWFGARLKPLRGDGELSAAGLSEERGLLVLEVEEKSAAARLGLRPRDVILSFDGKRASHVKALAEAAAAAAGRTIPVELQRDQRRIILRWNLP